MQYNSIAACPGKDEKLGRKGLRSTRYNVTSIRVLHSHQQLRVNFDSIAYGAAHAQHFIDLKIDGQKLRRERAS